MKCKHKRKCEIKIGYNSTLILNTYWQNTAMNVSQQSKVWIYIAQHYGLPNVL